MNKTIKILSFLILSIFFLFSNSVVAIDTVDAGFNDRFEFSKNIIKKNEKIKAYTYFDNNSDFDLKATMAFYMDGKKLENKTFFIPKNTRLPVWTTIRISEKSTLKAQLASLQKDKNGVFEGVYSNNKETKIEIEPNQSVPTLGKVQSLVVDNSKNVIEAAEQKRLDINSSLEESIKELKPEADKSDGLTFKKLWLWILNIFHFISDNFILSIIAFIIFTFYLFKISKKGYHKIR